MAPLPCMGEERLSGEVSVELVAKFDADVVENVADDVVEVVHVFFFR